MENMTSPGTLLSGDNATWLEEYYQTWLRAPEQLPEDWRRFFLSPELTVQSVSGDNNVSGTTLKKQAAVIQLINAWRTQGHLRAKLDPLGLNPPADVPSLQPGFWGLSEEDLLQEFSVTFGAHSQWQQVSLNALVEETLVLVQTAGVQARVDFISELDNELSPINADRELLKQVLLNILINAVQAISARGKIRIQTWQYSDSQQAISIEDNGCGIDLSLQKKIFDPFFTTKASGTGLGLALSQRIINAHQGDIRVASLPGYGATFTLILPINPQGNQTV